MWYWQHVLRVVFILTYHGLHFSKDRWPKLSSLCSCLNLSYNYDCVMSRKCFMWGSWSLETLLNFSTSIWLDEGLLLSHQNSYTNPFTASMEFISKSGNLPMKHKTSVWQESSCSLLEQYLWSALISNATSLDVGLRRQRALVLLFTIDCDNTRRVALRSFEHDLFSIVLNAYNQRRSKS